MIDDGKPKCTLYFSKNYHVAYMFESFFARSPDNHFIEVIHYNHEVFIPPIGCW